MLGRRAFVSGAAAFTAQGLSCGFSGGARAQGVSLRTCYPLGFTKLEGGAISLGDYVGKPILVVNTASLCGFTPQLDGLQALWTQMASRGLMMIGAPSNDFGGQEPGGPSEIREMAQHYGVSFPLTEKVRVTGADAHPFYRWALGEKPKELPRWNFHKYLVGADGHLAASFSTDVGPGDARILTAIEKELRAGPG